MRRLVLLALAASPLACADPCVDDGVNQKDKAGDCPGQAASAGETEGGTTAASASQTESASASASQSESASATQASMSGTSVATDDASASGADTSATDATATEDATATGGPGCTNGMLDGDESDVDCGGSCPPCDDGQICNASTDCESMMCTTDMICGGTDSCTELIDDNGCQACIKASCCDDILECYMDDFCRCWVECIEHNNDFDPCVQMCDGTGKPGEVTSCANSQCNDPGACGD